VAGKSSNFLIKDLEKNQEVFGTEIKTFIELIDNLKYILTLIALNN